jgi:hypothetical protein
MGAPAGSGLAADERRAEAQVRHHIATAKAAGAGAFAAAATASKAVAAACHSISVK